MNLTLESLKQTGKLSLIILVCYAALMLIVRIFLFFGFDASSNSEFLGIKEETKDWFVQWFMITPLKTLGWILLCAAILVVPALIFRALYKEFM